MNDTKKYKIFKADNVNTVYECICKFDKCFMPTITQRKPDKMDYALKLFKNAETFILENNDVIIGFLSAYINDISTKTAYLTLIAVEDSHRKCGLGEILLNAAEAEAVNKKFKHFKLEVHNHNFNAINFYKNRGFREINESIGDSFYMIKEL